MLLSSEGQEEDAGGCKDHGVEPYPLLEVKDNEDRYFLFA